MLSIEKHSWYQLMWLIAQSSQTLGGKGDGGREGRGKQRLHKAPFLTPTHSRPIDRRSCGLCGLLWIIAFCHAISHAKSENFPSCFQAQQLFFHLLPISSSLSLSFSIIYWFFCTFSVYVFPLGTLSVIWKSGCHFTHYSRAL